MTQPMLVVTAPVRDGISGWGGFVADMELGQAELMTEPPNAFGET